MTEEKKALIAVAVCLTGIVAGWLSLRGREAPAVVTRERMANLQTAIEQWTSAHGNPPTTLQELGLGVDEICDHAGSEFRYTVDSGGRIRLISYGADGKPGGALFRADTEVNFQVELQPGAAP